MRRWRTAWESGGSRMSWRTCVSSISSLRSMRHCVSVWRNGTRIGSSTLMKSVELVKRAMQENGLAGQVYGRPKHLYGIYQKMNKQSITFEEVYDLTALADRDRYQDELLRRARGDSLSLAARAWALQGLHRDSKVQSLSVSAYDGGGSEGGACRIPNPHGGDASYRRARHRRALEV